MDPVSDSVKVPYLIAVFLLLHRDKLFDEGQGFGQSVSASMNKDVKGKTHTYYQVIIFIAFFIRWFVLQKFKIVIV